MDWQSLWAWYAQAREEIQQEILDQIQINKFIRELAPKYQVEVLQNAPRDVIFSVRHLLSAFVEKRLGLETVLSPLTTDQSRKELLRIMLK